MRNRGIGRGRIFFGELMLAAAVMTWATALLMSPHGSTVAEGTEHVRSTVVTFMRNSAVGTLAMSALAGWLLFPARRPRKPWRDWAIISVLAAMVLSSLYQLVWLRTAVG